MKFVYEQIIESLANTFTVAHRKEPRFENGLWIAPDGVKFTLESAARDYCKRYFG